MLRRFNRLLKIIREVNLDAIREQAEATLPTVVVSDSEADRDAMLALLLGDASRVAPSGSNRISDTLLLASPEHVEAVLGRQPIKLALVVSRSADLSPAVENARHALVVRDIPVIVVLLGSAGFLDTFARHGEHARVVLPAPGPDQASHIADSLFDAVAPDRRIALARQFPGFRQPLFDRIIDETSRANASFAFSTGLAEIVPLLDVPLNVGDIIVLTKNQLIMAYRLALAAGKEGRPMDVIGEVLGVIGGGLLFRQVARELIGLVPVIGIVPKVAVAYGGTWAIGRAVVAWATGAEETAKRSLQHLYTVGLERGREVARQLTGA